MYASTARIYAQMVVDQYFLGKPLWEVIAAVKDLAETRERRNEKLRALETGRKKDNIYFAYRKQLSSHHRKRDC